MCLILFAHNSHPEYPFVVAANRDEFYQRPTRPAAFWPAISDNDHPSLFAGQDLVHGGTWMGITLSGRFAAVTNYREKSREEALRPSSGQAGGRREKGKAQEATIHPEHKSRGILVRDFLTGEMDPEQYSREVLARGDSYGGFNLLLKDPQSFWYCSNRSPEPVPVQPGVHGLSNHLLDTPWPKIAAGKQGLKLLLETGDTLDSGKLFPVLDSKTVAPDKELPDTGYGIQLERLLSSPFIVSPEYGTRSSTVMLVDMAGEVTFVERNFTGPDDPGEESKSSFKLL